MRPLQTPKTPAPSSAYRNKWLYNRGQIMQLCISQKDFSFSCKGGWRSTTVTKRNQSQNTDSNHLCLVKLRKAGNQPSSVSINQFGHLIQAHLKMLSCFFTHPEPDTCTLNIAFPGFFFFLASVHQQ